MRPHRLYEDEHSKKDPDPDRTPIDGTKLLTQPYDLVVFSLLGQIRKGTLHLRQLSDRPKFQRWYIWPDTYASLLIESILINVPIPPCYFAQNGDFGLDVIDGQQRIYSIYRFVDNRFKLRGMKVLTHLNGKYYHELPQKTRRRISNYTLRCIVIMNESDPEIRFEVFERLNSYITPLNAQELRNSICRGSLIDLLVELATDQPWLKILNRKSPDKRMRGEELILRFFAFQLFGLDGYFTPHKRWLDKVALQGSNYSPEEINKLASLWKDTIQNCLIVFTSRECFRRLPFARRPVINRALMDLTMYSLAGLSGKDVHSMAKAFYGRYIEILKNEEFEDLITRSIDHKSRTLRRFEMWSEWVTADLF